MGPILGESNLMQIYGNFEGFPVNNSALAWVGNIMTPVEFQLLILGVKDPRETHRLRCSQRVMSDLRIDKAAVLISEVLNCKEWL